MADDKKISFSASDNGVSAFMKKMQADGKALYESFATEAKKQTSSQKEQFRIINDQLKALKENLKIQKEITQERLKQAKAFLETEPGHTAEGASLRAQAMRAVKKREQELADISEREKVIKSARGENKTTPSQDSKSIFKDLLNAGLFRDMLSIARQVPNQENGLGLLSPMMSFTGGAAGASSGWLMDTIVKVATAGQIDLGLSAKLGNVGKEGMGFMGDAITRSFKIRDQYDQSYNKFRAVGGTGNSANLSGMGFDDIAVANAMGQVSGSAGTARGANRNTLAMLSLSRGYNIDEGTSLGAIGMQRSGGGNGVFNMQRGLGLAIAEGLDRAKFSDVIRTQTQLLQHFAQTSTNASAIEANRTMFEFNRIGGQFGVGDARSMSNIMKVSEGLSNPGTDFGQAQNYITLRKLKPNAGIFDLLKYQEQGLQTPGFLKGILNEINSSSGSEDFKKLQLQQRTKLSYAATENLWEGYKEGKVGSMTDRELSKTLGLDRVQKEAEELTSRYTRMNAEVTNAFRDDFVKGIHVLSEQFVEDMGRAIKEVAAMIGEDPTYTPPGEKTPLKAGQVKVSLPNGGSRAVEENSWLGKGMGAVRKGGHGRF